MYFISFSGSEEKTADRFIEALESKDTAVLRELLDSSQSTIVINDTSIQALLDATSDGSILRDVENDLKNKSSIYFTIKEQKHSLLFKKQYVCLCRHHIISPSPRQRMQRLQSMIQNNRYPRIKRKK